MTTPGFRLTPREAAYYLRRLSATYRLLGILSGELMYAAMLIEALSDHKEGDPSHDDGKTHIPLTNDERAAMIANCAGATAPYNWPIDAGDYSRGPLPPMPPPRRAWGENIKYVPKTPPPPIKRREISPTTAIAAPPAPVLQRRPLPPSPAKKTGFLE